MKFTDIITTRFGNMRLTIAANTLEEAEKKAASIVYEVLAARGGNNETTEAVFNSEYARDLIGHEALREEFEAMGLLIEPTDENPEPFSSIRTYTDDGAELN